MDAAALSVLPQVNSEAWLVLACGSTAHAVASASAPPRAALETRRPGVRRLGTAIVRICTRSFHRFMRTTRGFARRRRFACRHWNSSGRPKIAPAIASPAMSRHVVLLRGINLGARNRVAMPQLRELLTGAGFDDVRTYLQSGNVVLSSAAAPEQVARECERQIATGFGLDIAVVTRTRDELAAVVEHNPLRAVAANPKRYQVSFLAAELTAEAADRVAAEVVAPEQLVVSGRELYAWHPDGVGRSRLATRLAGRGLGVTATARNWTTVESLLALADA